MKYPKYPMLFTPETVSSSIIIKKIGTLQIILNNTTQSKTFNITVFELNPYYLYLKVPREVYISGEYFILKDEGPDGIRISSPYIVQKNTDEVKFILLRDVEGRTINHPETVSLKGAQLEKIDDYIVKIKIEDPSYEWYLDYLNESFEGKDFANVTYFPEQNEIQIELDNVTLSLSMVGDGDEDEYEEEIEEALNITAGVLYLTLGDGSVVAIKNGSDPTVVDLTDTFTIKSCGKKHGHHGSSCKDVFVATTLYISGFTNYSNAPAVVRMKYVFEDDDEGKEDDDEGKEAEGNITTRTVWYTMSNGYLQISFTVPLTTWSGDGCGNSHLQDKTIPARIPGGGGSDNTHNQLPNYINITINVNGGKETYRAKLEIPDFDRDSS